VIRIHHCISVKGLSRSPTMDAAPFMQLSGKMHFWCEVAAAVREPARQDDARALLRQRFPAPAATSLKERLTSAPLGIDLERSRDLGRDPADLRPSSTASWRPPPRSIG